MKIGLTFDLKSEYLEMGFTKDETAEFDSDETISALEETIKSLGHDPVRIGNIYDLNSRLSAGQRWDLVFNISEGLYGRSREAQVPALLEAYNIPYVFSDPLTLALCLDKEMTKRVVRDAGIFTPEFFVVKSVENLKEKTPGQDIPFPLFVKPLSEGTSKGIGPESIVSNAAELERRCDSLIKKYNQPVLVEQYLPGGEFTLGILGTDEKARVIGIIEVKLLKSAEPGVYSFMNKELYRERVKYNLVKDKDIISEASDIALTAYRTVGCRDAGRVDIKADKSGKLHFLEMNPLAGLHPVNSDLPILCGKAGISYRELISEIVTSALERVKNGTAFKVPAGVPVFSD